MIARGLWTNNGPGGFIHRFHKRESCVFHSIHRFRGRFPAHPSTPLTCGNAGTERLFALGEWGTTHDMTTRGSLSNSCIDMGRRARIYSSGFAPKPGRS
jgi:hypothetical protein